MSSSLRGEVCGELLHATVTSVWVRVKMPGGVTGVKMARRHCSYSTQSQHTPAAITVNVNSTLLPDVATTHHRR
jgi:hypothetical protein